MTEVTEGHTVKRFDGELSHLHELGLEMGGLVIDQLQRAIKALNDKGLDAARNIIARDHLVNELELKADEAIVRLIARRQPMGGDLRIVMAISKAVTDLERIGDEAKKIGDLVLRIYDNDAADPNQNLLRDVTTMGKLASSMLRQSLMAFDGLDPAEAMAVIGGHPELDSEFQSGLRRLTTFILEDSRNVGHAINIVLAIKALERIGDHAKNIAQYVVYMVQGKDVRHGGAVSQSQKSIIEDN